MVHVAEMETVFKSALSEVILRHLVKTFSNNEIEVLALFLKHEKKGDRTAVFINLSSLPSELKLEVPKKECAISLLDPAECNILIKDSSEVLNLQWLIMKTKSLLLDSESQFKCHSALVPTYVYTIDCFPTAGAAGKVDKRALTELASAIINKNPDSGDVVSANEVSTEKDNDGRFEMMF